MILNKNWKNSSKKNYQVLINEINSLENELKILSDSEIRNKRFKLQKKYETTENLNDLINFSFALTREASQRTLGLRHFDVQLMGGFILNKNKIAEMKTGEGKTLVATLPASLNALTKKGVHIVTVNDYLANRDQIAMGQIYRFLGFDTGLIQEKTTNRNRRENYLCDITYVTNNELAFDYLRDNTTIIPSEIVLRPFNFCIIDEVDSILIDEAQTPLILSNTINENDAEKYIIASEAVKYIDINIDFKVDEKDKNVILTESGNQKIEQLIQVENLYNSKNPWIPYILNALKARTLFFNNIHYIVKNNKVLIVDEFTGRIMADRRWGDGLHQAIEAKEDVTICQRTETTASITYQNFFLMYPKLSGMTGTGKTAEIEFEKIYNLSVELVPTFRPVQRIDLPDLIYKDQFSKWNSIAKLCHTISITGQPILIGTTTVEKSEMLAQLLNEYKLAYQILNAKPENVRRESQIVGQAGKQNSITIATNMAGRGTDIILGGNLYFKIQRDIFNLLITARICMKKIRKISQFNERTLRQQFLKNLNEFKSSIGYSQKLYSILTQIVSNLKFLNFSDIEVLKVLQQNDRISLPQFTYQYQIRFLLKELTYTNKKNHRQQNKIVKNLGGLYVIGTERNDSRRIDNQLRGRCGRQGDPGISHFFLSLDDNLLRLFGGPTIQKTLQNKIPDNLPLESILINKALDSAQQRVEERAYEQRKNLFDYDKLINGQRNIIYFNRRCILLNTLTQINNLAYGEQMICQLFNGFQEKRINLSNIIQIMENFIGKNLELNNSSKLYQNGKNYQLREWKNYFYQEFWLNYQLTLQEMLVYGDDTSKCFEKRISLLNCDKTWKDHLQKLLLLREAVGWRSYAQTKPLTEYNREGYQIFLNRYEDFLYYTLYHTLRINII